MLLATRCPFCETVFRLQPTQLALRRGLVRCGQCHEVFDASGSLYDISEGGDFSTARHVSAAAAMEALSGTRPSGADFSPAAWDPWAPRPTPLFEERFRHNAENVSAGPRYTDARTDARTLAAPGHAAAGPELSAGASGASGAAARPDHEPVLAYAPLEPFAYEDEPRNEPTSKPISEPTSRPPADEAPRVWHKTERPAGSPADEPVFNEPTSFHGFPDNEPHFGTTGVGAAGLGTTHPHLDDPDLRGPARAAATPGGEPFSVNPVNDDADPFPVVRETRPAEPRRLAWIIDGSVAAGLLVIALLAQLAWWQRETVLVYLPSTQALYAKACAQLGCQITAPHDIDGLQVEPSDLRQVDVPHKLELRMPLRNRFNVALAYPAIQLTLLDDQNNIALRRVLWRLDTGNAVASNFRVQIFYP
ncbi:MAG: Putative transmembrane protein [uncultured Paraburkholderia sp.]|nr:MAG: Putative transmembrane protein [uncultured Paraburkholderia sp.]CAH2777331.1 MAG: Putative transmembrane protein [uncultured Paraburkholderia sp.]CAH2912727.1 MAG: Putative transmembrane protein [uncultured Paraburkholderia sp.]